MICKGIKLNLAQPEECCSFKFIVDYRPVNTIVTTNLTNNVVVVNETFSITCSAQANPSAKYRLYKGKEYVNDADNDVAIITSVVERARMVNYSCIPFNIYGNGTQGALAVTLHCKYLIVYPLFLLESCCETRILIIRNRVHY